jgi:hypothetical protein
MPSPARVLAAVSFLVLLTSLASAQHPGSFPDTPGVIPSDWLPPPAPSSSPALSGGPLPWHVDLLLGLPGGLRVQRTLGGSPWMIEGFAGLELILPTAGLGLRRQCVLLEGDCNALTINPGVDAYVALLPTGHGTGLAPGGGYFTWGAGGAVVGDVDVVWRHAIGDGAESQLGLKLGMGGVAGHRIRALVPVAGVFIGWGF